MIKLTDQDKTRMVLLACGWKTRTSADGVELWLGPGRSLHTPIPPILTSLDACREVFEADAPVEYWIKLMDTVNTGHEQDNNETLTFRLLKAIPKQRLEAFGQFKELWRAGE